MKPLSQTEQSHREQSQTDSPVPRKVLVAVLCVFAMVTAAFTAHAAGITGVTFERTSTFIVLMDGEVAANFRQLSDAQSEAGRLKTENPDAYVGYIDTVFHEAHLDVSAPTPTAIPTATPEVSPTAIPTATPEPAVPGTELPTRLLNEEDFAYQGSFTVPFGPGGSEAAMTWVGTGLAYNPARDSLFLTAHDWHQYTAEISIPALSRTTDPSALPEATMLRSPEDATDGQLQDLSETPDAVYGRVGGYLVDGEQLLVSGFDYYDAGDDQVRSHFVTDINLGPAGEAQSLSDAVPARWLGGSMAHIPQQWQAAFGGDSWMTGLSGVAIAGNASNGPAVATFSPATLQGEDPAQLVLGYPLAEALDGPETTSDVWNLTSAPRGVVFPSDTASVLFFGLHGTGTYCYGTGAECNDPVSEYQGTHAAPYRAQMWAYNAADLVAVANGERTPQSLRPYTVAGFDLPYASDYPAIVGAAYDQATGRIFLTQARANGNRPVIHVYTVRDAATPMPTATAIAPMPTATSVPPTTVPPTTVPPTTVPPTTVPVVPTPTAVPIGSSNPCPAYVDSDLYRPRANQITLTPDQDWELIMATTDPDTEILLVDGEYRFTRAGVWMEQADLTIRSASGNRDAVVLIGQGNTIRGEGLMAAGPNMTIADITIRENRDHAIALHPSVGGTTTHVYNVNLVDIGTQSIKGNPGADNPDGVVACSAIGFSSLDAVDGDYFGAIDLHQVVDWTIRDNYIYNMVGDGSGCLLGTECGTYFSHPAILVWNNSSGTIIERNTMIENTRSITLGLASGHSGGVVRNNFIYQSLPGDAGIELWDAEGVLVEHNTVITNNYPGAIEYGGSPNITLRNNLLSNPPLDRTNSRGASPGAVIEGNINDATDADLVAPGDVHLPAGSRAIGAGVTPAESSIGDIDSQSRNGRWDVGADHFSG